MSNRKDAALTGISAAKTSSEFCAVNRKGLWTKALLSAASLAVLTAAPTAAIAQEDDEARQDTVVVQGSLRALPVEDVGSVFGFDKPLTEIPRSASTISSEQLERFAITDIYGLVAQAPGTFTNSFFGVGGALDIRGTPGETYFRGVRRLDNPGNYPTPIGASDRIDIVRGPASPIYGPSKTGGYLNFVPKTARLSAGKYIDQPEGEVRYTTGSWDKSILSASVTGPGQLFGKEFGYNLYAELEDSGSYFNNVFTNQTILQSAFDMDLTDEVRVEFGAMYHDFDGTQNGGWNRLTQDLVDNGTYITGDAQPLDVNGDGQLSYYEFFAADFNPNAATGGAPPASYTDASFDPLLALVNVGTTKLSRQNVLTGEDDLLKNEMITLYFDVIYENNLGLEIKNQMFYEAYENTNENDYGFSQFHDSYVFEDKLVISKDIENDAGKFAFQFSPSIRYTNFEHGDDYFFEYFHRIDLSKGTDYDALSDRLLALEEGGMNFAEYYKGDYIDYGVAGLADLDFNFGLNLLFGLRYDYFDVKSTTDQSLCVFGCDPDASDKDEGISWTASASYDLPYGIKPYITASEQSTVIAGQGAEISTGNVADGTFLSTSELFEFGVKGSFLDDRLYAAIAVYEQERTDYNAQSVTVNQAVKTEGLEAEMRWSVTDNLLITAAYTNTKVINLTMLEAGAAFSFCSIEDLINVLNPAATLGGQPACSIPIPDEDAARRAGIPEDIYSLTATYEFDNGFSLQGSIVDVDSVYSGLSQVVKLPAYTLVDLGASYELDDWLFRLTVKNATDEEYYRANFTELFGSTIVLPEAPRSVQASIIYKF